MDRPLENVRPLGPFAQLGNKTRGTRVTEIKDDSIIIKTSNLSKARARGFVEDWVSDNFTP